MLTQSQCKQYTQKTPIVIDRGLVVLLLFQMVNTLYTVE